MDATEPYEPKLRVLFVDDEPMMLAGFRLLFRKERHRWDMVFATSGAEAVQLMARDDFDVVVSDMKMPAMDGATLLRATLREHPATCRILLSGHASVDELARALPIVHSYVTKPCKPDSLRSVIERYRRVRVSLPERELRELVCGLTELPRFHRSTHAWAAISDAMHVHERTEALATEPAFCAKLLQVANCPAFGDTDTTSLTVAFDRLGPDIARALLTSTIICDGDRELMALHAGSMRLAESARARAPSADAELAFTTGLLWHLGEMALVLAQRSQRSTVSEHLGRKICANILRLWSMPEVVASAIDLEEPCDAHAFRLRSYVLDGSVPHSL